MESKYSNSKEICCLRIVHLCLRDRSAASIKRILLEGAAVLRSSFSVIMSFSESARTVTSRILTKVWMEPTSRQSWHPQFGQAIAVSFFFAAEPSESSPILTSFSACPHSGQIRQRSNESLSHLN